MRAAPAWRGAAALAAVLFIGATAQAFLAEPAPAPPRRLVFGDHAEYNVTVIDLESGIERPSAVKSLAVEVGAASTVADTHGHPVLATPLEFRFGFPTPSGHAGQIATTYWLSGNTAVAITTKGIGASAQDGLGTPAPAAATEATQTLAWSTLHWRDTPLPCGFQLEGVPHAEPGCRHRFENGEPWPVEVVASLSDLLGTPGAGRVAHRLELSQAGRSIGTWSSPPAIAALPPSPQAPRGDLGPAGNGPGAFTLADAFDALASSPTDPAARDLRSRHPDAYLAYAKSYQAADLAGNQQQAWHVVLVGGSERVERAIVREPAASPLLPDNIQVLPPGDLDYPVDAPPSVLPPSSLAPATLPSLDGLRIAFTAATGKQPTAWGFEMSCPSRSCFTVNARVHMQAEQMAAAPTAATRWHRSIASRDTLTMGGAGELEAVEHVDYGSPTPDLLAQGPFEARREQRRDSNLFPFPSAPAAVTVGTLGLLAAAIAAGWPALKVYLPLFSRIEASRLLDHPMRRRVHDLVHEEPGIHASQVAARLGIAGNTAHHHLERLVAAAYLGERRIAGYHCYFPRGGLDERLQDAVPLLRSRGAQAVLLAIQSQGAPSFRSMMAATGLGYATVHHHAQKLWKAGLVSEEKDGKARRFRLTELGRRVSEQTQASLGRFPKQPKNDPTLHHLP